MQQCVICQYRPAVSVKLFALSLFTATILLAGTDLASAGESLDQHFPGREQLLALGKLGDFVSVYRVLEYGDEQPADAPPRISYRRVMIVHQGEVKSYILDAVEVLPSKRDLIAFARQARQYASLATTWEWYNPRSGILTIKHKPDPWVPGTRWNPNGFDIESFILPFEPLGWQDGAFAGTSHIEWRDWFNQKWIDGIFRKLLKGPVTQTEQGCTFQIAMLEADDGGNGGQNALVDKGRRIAFTIDRHPEFGNMPLIDRYSYVPLASDAPGAGGGHSDFTYVLKHRQDGDVPVVQGNRSYLVAGKLYQDISLEYFDDIAKGEHVELDIDPALAKRIWDDTFHLDIEAK